MLAALPASRSVTCFALAMALSFNVVACKKKNKSETAPSARSVAESSASPPGNAITAGPALDGLWRITQAVDATGKAYAGNVQVSRSGEAWEMAWKLTDGGTQGGVGIDCGNGILAAGFGGSEAYGVIVYDVAGGTLTGKWAQKGIRTLGTENLSGPTGMGGVYTVTSAQNPVGAAYTGSVRITPNGQLYDMTWSTGGSTQRGVAILEGSKLIAGWGTAGGAGVVRYKITPTRLEGVWAPVGGNRWGTEILER